MNAFHSTLRTCAANYRICSAGFQPAYDARARRRCQPEASATNFSHILMCVALAFLAGGSAFLAARAKPGALRPTMLLQSERPLPTLFIVGDSTVDNSTT